MAQLLRQTIGPVIWLQTGH